MGKILQFPEKNIKKTSCYSFENSLENFIKSVSSNDETKKRNFLDILFDQKNTNTTQALIHFNQEMEKNNLAIENIKKLPFVLKNKSTNDFLFIVCSMFGFEISEAINFYLNAKRSIIFSDYNRKI